MTDVGVFFLGYFSGVFMLLMIPVLLIFSMKSREREGNELNELRKRMKKQNKEKNKEKNKQS